jgi:hypothetical protein
MKKLKIIATIKDIKCPQCNTKIDVKDRFCPTCGNSLGEQHLMWIPPGEDTGAPSFKVSLLNWPWPNRIPIKIWSIFSEKKPELPFIPKHGVNAFLEDAGHDWQIINNKLKWTAHSSLQEEGHWILIEF